MTDVIDDSLTWEQRREIRRKKRQELLAEADRVVKASGTSQTTDDSTDSFEQERQRRRKEREEKRRKEREELERQLKQEDEARATRERLREERRRQRDEDVTLKPADEKIQTATDNYNDEDANQQKQTDEEGEEEEADVEDSEITHSDERHETNGIGDEEVDNRELDAYDSDDKQDKYDPEPAVEPESESVQEPESESVQELESEHESEPESEPEPEPEPEPTVESEPEPVPEPEPIKSTSDTLSERKRERERRRLEQEELEKEAARKQKEEYEAKLEAERQERARRMAESEARRNELKKQVTAEKSELAPKGSAAAPILMKKPERTRGSGGLKHGCAQVPTVDNSSSDAPSQKETKRSRRSLRALEKQAGDLYSFLSELEVQKSAGPERLKEFLQNTEEKPGKSTSSPRRKLNAPSATLGESKTRSAAIDTSKDADREMLRRSGSNSPKPPVRQDSMKRLEDARSKYLRKGLKEPDPELNVIEDNEPSMASPSKLASSAQVRPRSAHTEISDNSKARKPDESQNKKNEIPKEAMVKDLSNKMSEAPKSQRSDTSIAKVSSLDDRLKSYTSRAARQDTSKKSVAAKPGPSDLASRLNMWESGKVATPDKSTKKNVDTSVVKQSKGVSSRKNMWETGAVVSSVEKKTVRTSAHGADLASRKNLWLKATQEPAEKSPLPKSDDKQVIKVGVSTRLNKWEKGEVTSSNAETSKSKFKDSNVPISDVSNRRSKWENISQDSATRPARKTRPETNHFSSDVSARKNLYESKSNKQEGDQSSGTTDAASGGYTSHRGTARRGSSLSSQSDALSGRSGRDSDCESNDAADA